MTGYRSALLVAASLACGAGCASNTVAPRAPAPPAPSVTVRGSRNAAILYAKALNSYTRRLEPAQRRAARDGVVHEPSISQPELDALLRGARCPDCDFYGADRIVFQRSPGERPWVFSVAADPFEFRPYPVPIRRLAQAALNEGQRRIEARRFAEARRIFDAVAAFGAHLRRHPGSLVDLQVGLDIQRRAMHYLQALDQRTGRSADRRAHAAKDAELRAEQDAFLAKYASLDEVGRAADVLLGDREPVWRIAAATALTLALHTRRLTPTEAERIRRSLRAAAADPDPNVRRSLEIVTKLTHSDFGPEAPPPRAP